MNNQLVIISRKSLKNIIAVGLKNHDTLIEMMMFQCRGRVQLRQRGIDFRLEGVVRSSMIEIVTETGYQQANCFEITHMNTHTTGLEQGRIDANTRRPFFLLLSAFTVNIENIVWATLNACLQL